MPDLLSIVARPVWALCCPLIAAVLILLSGSRPNLREAWTLLGGIGLCAAVLSMTSHVLAHGPIRFDGFVLLPNHADIEVGHDHQFASRSQLRHPRLKQSLAMIRAKRR